MQKEQIVKVILTSGIITSGLVIGCNKSIGITIIKEDDSSRFLLCYNGPLSPNNPGAWTFDEKDTIIHRYISRQIELGAVNLKRCMEFDLKVRQEGVSSYPTIENCPFGQ